MILGPAALGHPSAARSGILRLVTTTRLARDTDLPHLASIEDAGDHLVEQRLEKVVIRTADDGHVDRRPAEKARREEAAEARADDDDAMPIGASGIAHEDSQGSRQSP